MCLFIISFGDLRFFLFDYFIALCSLYTCTPLALYYYQLLWHKQFLFFVDFFPFDRTLSIFCIMSFGSNNKTCAMSSKTFVQALGFIIFDFLAISIDDMVCTVFNSCANFPSMLAIYNNKWEWIIFFNYYSTCNWEFRVKHMFFWLRTVQEFLVSFSA